MCLAFPDLYEIGMSHLGFKILYGLVNDREDMLAGRARALARPRTTASKPRRGRAVPGNGKPLSEFDVVGFSLSELTYTNILPCWNSGASRVSPTTARTPTP